MRSGSSSASPADDRRDVVALDEPVEYQDARPGREPGLLRRTAVDQVTDYVRAHLAQAITLDALATAVSCGPFHFARTFKATTAMTPHAFVTEQRLTVARDDILRTTASVADVASAVGYANVSHFRRLFRRRFGMPPGALRAA